MNIGLILQFLSELKNNNNREWFTDNKVWYDAAKSEFEAICTKLIAEIARFDEDITHVNARDCIFRIYRDIRFSNDKTPYKTHFGAFIAAAGGRKSNRAGYYLHIDPEGCFVASGIWCPPPDLLKALRKSIFENIEEFEEIISENEFIKYNPKFYEDEKLKSVPTGFPKDFRQAELLKLKHYMVEYKLDEKITSDENFVQNIAVILKSSHPLMLFLNYTADEVLQNLNLK